MQMSHTTGSERLPHVSALPAIPHSPELEQQNEKLKQVFYVIYFRRIIMVVWIC